MTRRFLDDVRADINAAIIPNINGDITADVLRPLLIDTIDSTIDDEGGLLITASQLAYTVTDNWVPLLFDSAVGGDGDFITPDPVSESITTSATPGFTYKIDGALSILGGNNEVFQLAIGVAGLPVGYIGEITTRGNGRPGGVAASHLSLSTSSSSVFQLMMRCSSSASTNIDISSGYLLATIKPTNNP